jgi:hypothetical protein
MDTLAGTQHVLRASVKSALTCLALAGTRNQQMGYLSSLSFVATVQPVYADDLRRWLYAQERGLPDVYLSSQNYSNDPGKTLRHGKQHDCNSALL